MKEKPTEGAMRAVDQIIDSIIRGMKIARQIPQESNIYDLRKAAKKDWAAIIDKETAAPDLLEALELAISYFQTQPYEGLNLKAWKAAEKAIAKARGK